MNKLISLYIQPNASKNEICGEHNGLLKIRIKSPATDNLANKELIKFLSKYLNIKQRQVTIVRGFNSRCKTIEFDIVDTEMHGVCSN